MKTRLFSFLLGALSILILSSAGKIKAPAKASIGYYSTYQDYLDKKIVPMDDYVGAGYYGENVGFIFKNDGKKVKIKGDDIWGFIYKNALFRVVPDKPAFARIISKDKIIYYENGHAHTTMLIEGKTKASFQDGDYIYFSKDLNSPMLAWTDSKSKWNSFFDQNTQYKTLYNCIQAGKRSFEETRLCASTYNGTNVMYTE